MTLRSRIDHSAPLGVDASPVPTTASVARRFQVARGQRVALWSTSTAVVLVVASHLGCAGQQQATPGNVQPAGPVAVAPTGPTETPRLAAMQTAPTGFEVTGDTSPQTLADGQKIFRFETFGNEEFWTDTLGMNEVVEKAVDPTTALKVGLKVDSEVLPPGILQKVDLKSPATTVALLKMNAVVGLKAEVDESNHIRRFGITCALCHSNVDNSVMAGIGKRKDGWANRDLNPGAIIALSPKLTASQKAVYGSWGPGKFDPRYNHDGKSTPIVIPPAYGLAKIKNSTYTAEGPISYWNAYVAVTEMGGHGSFSDPRLGIEVKKTPDMVGPKLAALRAYQHSLAAPAPPAGSVDAAAAERGRATFNRSCSSCHSGASGTDNNEGKLHSPAEIGADGAYAARSTTKAYRTTPLRGLSQHPPYYHDGSKATLDAVVDHYDKLLNLKLTREQKLDLVQYLKTL